MNAADTSVAFVVKIDAGLTKILFSTRLGGSQQPPPPNVLMYATYKTVGNAVALDSAGNMYVTGATSAPDFPTTSGAFQTRMPPSSNTQGYTYITEIGSPSYKIVYSTLYGGSTGGCVAGAMPCSVPGAYTSASAIAVDANGAAVIAGTTNALNLPVTPGTPGQVCVCALESIGINLSAGFIAKVAPGGTQLVWATYISLPVADLGNSVRGVNVSAMALDGDGNVAIGGSTGYDFPTTAGVLQPMFPGIGNPFTASAAFISKYSSNGQQILFSTFFGATSPSISTGVAALGADSQGTIWLTGSAPIGTLPFPASTSQLGTNYVAALSPDGTQLLDGFTVPLGGSGQGPVITPQGSAVALGLNGSLITEKTGQQPAIAGVVNSAGIQATGQVALYEMVSIYGYGFVHGFGTLLPQTGQITNGVLSSSLEGVRVTFDGIPAPLLYVGPNQINAIVPGGIAGHATTVLQVTQFFGASDPVVLFVTGTSPAIFCDASQVAFALNQDGTLNSAANPAAAGTVIAVWATGAGAYAVPETDGQVNGTTSLQQPVAPISVLSNATTSSVFALLPVVYAGDAPDLLAGAIQVNFRLHPALSLPGYTPNPYFELGIQLQAGMAASTDCSIYAQTH